MAKGAIPDRDELTAAFVRQRRQAVGLTQHELGDLAGVGHRFVVELEGGKPTVRLDKVNQVLAVFGMRVGPVLASRDGSAAS